MAATALTRCPGNCVYGDPLFGNDPDAYDGSQCGCVRCEHFSVCQEWIGDTHGGCIVNLVIPFTPVSREYAPPVTCPICLEDKGVHIEHPARCGHTVCRDCFKEAWIPSIDVDLDPRDYGFTTTCTCKYCADDEAYPCETAMTAWETARPDQTQTWHTEENAQTRARIYDIASRPDPSRCCVCRAHADLE